MGKKHIKARTIVVKIGSAVMLRPDGTLNEDFILRIARQIRVLKQAGILTLLVVSGAVATGRRIMRKDMSSVEKQIAAGIGQAYITSSYWRIFHDSGVILSQFLLTKSQIHARNLTQLRNALLTTLQQGVVPFLNENDAVLPNCFGGNDHLAATIAHIVKADELIILSNVDGLLSKQSGKSHVIHKISRITKDILLLAWKTKSSAGIGGMRAKLSVAQELSRESIPTIIANGQTTNVLTRLILERQHIGTWIYSHDYAKHS